MNAVYATKDNLVKVGYSESSKLAQVSEKQKNENKAKLFDFLQNPISFYRAATETGSLFGSVSANDIKDSINKSLGLTEELNIQVPKAIKSIGQQSVRVNDIPVVIQVLPMS